MRMAAEFPVKIRPGGGRHPGDDQIVSLVCETLFGNIPAEIENRTTKTRQGCETGFRPRDRRLARIGKDVLDAIGRRRREQRRRQPTGPTPDLENTQRAGCAGSSGTAVAPPRPLHRSPCGTAGRNRRAARPRRSPAGRNQIDRIDLRPQDPGKRRTVSRDQLQAGEVCGIAE